MLARSGVRLKGIAMKYTGIGGAAVLAGSIAFVGLGGCRSGQMAESTGTLSSMSGPVSVHPSVDFGILQDPSPLPAERPIGDLTEEGAVAWGMTEAAVIDTRTFPQQIVIPEVPIDQARLNRVHRPQTTGRPVIRGDERDGLVNFPLGTTRDVQVIDQGSLFQFSAMDRTGWSPPDPTLAVGPDHIVSTVNQSIAWYTRQGTLQFQQILGSQGNPGFFGSVGAGNFTFDPKCFFDQVAQRFVVVALEVYTSTAYITIAVSDDADPNGVWYRYRTDAVINVSGTTYWWDFPGFGYDDDAYYVTGNLFGLSSSGFAGAGFRVFRKSDVLNGQPAVYSTLRDGGVASVQVAHHFGNTPAPYFVSTAGSGSIRIHAIENPITSPVLRSITVPVPGYSTIGDAPAQGGGSLFIVDGRIWNAQWRNGQLLATHHISVGGVAKPRWYEFSTNGWPFSGQWPSLVQSGNSDPGAGIHGFFPAIYSNSRGEIAMVYGTSSSTQTVGMVITGRSPSDPAGTMAQPITVRQSPSAGSDGRWGDYYDVAIDPNDGTTFWVIGQTQEPGIGWDTRIASFRFEAPPCPADLAPPFGILDLSDIQAFTIAFQAGLPEADFAPPAGVFDLADIQAFVAAFVAGCP